MEAKKNSFMKLHEQAPCFYCKKIRKYEPNYPIREGNFSTDNKAFRCSIHSQFQCSKCKKFSHFSWLYWCQKEQMLTCGNCNSPNLKPIGFWNTTYTYSFHCTHCDEDHYDLYYSEYRGTHPWQNNNERDVKTILRQDSDEENWAPKETREGERISLEDSLKTPNYVSQIRETFGSIKFHSPLLNHEKITQLQVQHQWERTSKYWLKVVKEQSQDDRGDINRQLIIDPVMWDIIGEVKGLKVLDAGCGNGYFSRMLANKGAKVTGIDQSETFINFCKEKEKEQKLDIAYYAKNLVNVPELAANTFDLIVSNIVFVDVLHYREVFKELARILKPSGRFNWSNLHPVFARVKNIFYRIPYDTPRNEERLYVMIDRYFDTGGTLVSWGNMEPIWQFDRTLSEYTTALKEASFVIREIVEPKPSKEVIKMNPRHLAFDSDRIPFFIVFDCFKYQN